MPKTTWRCVFCHKCNENSKNPFISLRVFCFVSSAFEPTQRNHFTTGIKRINNIHSWQARWPTIWFHSIGWNGIGEKGECFYRSRTSISTQFNITGRFCYRLRSRDFFRELSTQLSFWSSTRNHFYACHISAYLDWSISCIQHRLCLQKGYSGHQWRPLYIREWSIRTKSMLFPEQVLIPSWFSRQC